jgi:hypothetical protein
VGLIPLTTLVSTLGNPSPTGVTVNVGQWVYIYECIRGAGGPFGAAITYVFGTQASPLVGPLRKFAVGVPLNETTVFDWISPEDPAPAGVAPEVTGMPGPIGVWRGSAFFATNNPTTPPAEPTGAGGGWQCLQAWIDGGPNPGAPSFDLRLQSDSWQGSVPYTMTVRLAVSDLPPSAFSFFTTAAMRGEPGGGLF